MPRGMGSPVNELVGLVTFAFVGSVSPGPNNALLWASGVRFGFRATLPHVVGTAMGVGMLVLGVAAGIGVLIERMPTVELVLKVAGSAYLLYLAYLVSGSRTPGQRSVARPLTLWQGLAFQCANPKAWIFAVAAVGSFVPPALHRLVGAAALTGIVMAVVAGSSTIWAIGGAALRRAVEDERRRRAVNAALAVLLVGTVALIWV